MTAPASPLATEQALKSLIDSHLRLYESPDIDRRLHAIIREFPESKLSDWDTLRILRTARAVLFDVHVEVVSGHHTATYLRFDSIARIAQLVSVIARDMADWVRHRCLEGPITGLVVTGSSVQLLAERVVDLLYEQHRLRLVVTPFDERTGRIGTEVPAGSIRHDERFLVLNDVTTRGQCVSKLAKVVTDHGGALAGMMVFARRDSGQFPLMGELTAKYPFYYTVDVQMPQWEPADCPLCREGRPLLSWRDMPEL